MENKIYYYFNDVKETVVDVLSIIMMDIQNPSLNCHWVYIKLDNSDIAITVEYSSDKLREKDYKALKKMLYEISLKNIKRLKNEEDSDRSDYGLERNRLYLQGQ